MSRSLKTRRMMKEGCCRSHCSLYLIQVVLLEDNVPTSSKLLVFHRRLPLFSNDTLTWHAARQRAMLWLYQVATGFVFGCGTEVNFFHGNQNLIQNSVLEYMRVFLFFQIEFESVVQHTFASSALYLLYLSAQEKKNKLKDYKKTTTTTKQLCRSGQTHRPNAKIKAKWKITVSERMTVYAPLCRQ